MYRLFRFDLQLLLAVDAAILAVGAQLKDLVALFLNGGDAARVFAPHDVDQTLGGLGLLLLDRLAILDRLRQVGALGDLPESSQVSFF